MNSCFKAALILSLLFFSNKLEAVAESVKIPTEYVLGENLEGDEPEVQVEPGEYIETPSVERSEENEFKFAGRLLMPEVFFGKNLNLLNDCNTTDCNAIDRTFFVRHTLDLIGEYRYKPKGCDHEVLQFKTTIRNRAVWGDPEAIAPTTESDVKVVDVLTGTHKHFVPRLIFWARELWLEVSLPHLLHLDLENNHFITFGAFPFRLGRGIALGDAFATTPDPILGFSAESAVDQYAFGAKIWGDLIPKVLTYDIYGAILNNKADSFSNTAANIRGQEYGHRFCQARGFGVVNFVYANRLVWTPVLNTAKITVEPYWLFNSDPEQRVEFLGDAESRLVTLGIAGEFEIGDFEFGFDTAFNHGRQHVKGVDRNVVNFAIDQGFVTEINSQVQLVLNPGVPGQERQQNLPFQLSVQDAAGNTVNVQNIVNNSIQSESQNGAILLDNATLTNVRITGTESPVPVLIRNSAARFRDPYRNRYKGSMFVADGSYWLIERDLKASFAVGFASGDANPNRDIVDPFDASVDGVYKGFIGLQEIYPGTRVKSVLFLNGTGKIPRPLDLPSEDVNDRFASTVSRFTNLFLVGGSLRYKPVNSRYKTDINPNIIAFWQEFQSRRFDVQPPRLISPYLGLEVNLITEVELLEDLKFWSKMGIFFPGNLYKELRGRPVNREQARFLNSLNSSGVRLPSVPLLGDDTAFGLNFGFEYIF